MKSKIKGCTHHTTKVIQRAAEGGIISRMPDNIKSQLSGFANFRANHEGMFNRLRPNAGAPAAAPAAMPMAKKSPWKNTGPTMSNKNTA